MSPEVFLFSGYAALLLCVAGLLEWLSAHTHRRSLRYRTAGFEYDRSSTTGGAPRASTCGRTSSTTSGASFAIAPRPTSATAAHARRRCTDSSSGREIVRPLDPWPHSEAGRFHRGLSLVLVALSLLMLIVAGARNHEPAEISLSPAWWW